MHVGRLLLVLGVTLALVVTLQVSAVSTDRREARHQQQALQHQTKSTLQTKIKSATASKTATTTKQSQTQTQSQSQTQTQAKTSQNEEVTSKSELHSQVLAEANALHLLEQKSMASLASGLVALWDFDGPDPTTDRISGYTGKLVGGALVERGVLRLNGNGQYLVSSALQADLYEKTLEAWVSLGAYDQGWGGVVGVETTNGNVFDTIVYSEPYKSVPPHHHWLAGSDNHVRTFLSNPLEEEEARYRMVHVAATYTKDTITLYREGQQLEQYKISSLPTYTRGNAEFIFGVRHKIGGNPYFTGDISEARIYNRALSAAEVRSSYEAKRPFKPYVPERLAWAAGCIRETAWKLVAGEVIANSGQLPYSGYFTYMLWVKPLGVVSNWGSIFHKGQSDVNRNPAVWFFPNSLNIYVRSGNQNAPTWGNGGDLGCNPGYSFPLQEWTHVTITHGGGQIKVYINGFLGCVDNYGGPASNSGPLYAADSWYTAANAMLADFRYLNRIVDYKEIWQAYRERRGTMFA